MPTYRVGFERPVTYLTGHYLARLVTSLDVAGAEDEEAARRHALRVTTGDPGTLSVAQIKPDPAESLHA